MRIILKVSSSNEHCNGGCEFALLDLTPELARLAVGRIATLREQKSLDPDIEETYYWAYFAEYFSILPALERKLKARGSRWRKCWMNLQLKRRK